MAENRDSYMRDLAAVTVIAEASLYWGLSIDKLNRLCREGKLVSTQPDGSPVWLVSVRHLVEMFGHPNLPQSRAESFVDTFRNKT